MWKSWKNKKISCLTFSNNNDFLLIGSEDGSIIIYNLDNYYSIKLKDHSDPISDIIFAPNGKVFLSITPNIIYLYDFNNFSYEIIPDLKFFGQNEASLHYEDSLNRYKEPIKKTNSYDLFPVLY